MPVVDVHTHMYPPVSPPSSFTDMINPKFKEAIILTKTQAYMSLLRSRTTVPYVKSFDSTGERLVILPAEDTASTSRGRPIGPEYYSLEEKLAFMDTHGISISVISLANPWLDWLPSSTAAETAMQINDDTEAMCAEAEGRLYAFATLPLSAPIGEVVAEVERVTKLRHVRGVVMGSSGLGEGLDDPRLDPVWEALEREGMVIVSTCGNGWVRLSRVVLIFIPVPPSALWIAEQCLRSAG